MNNKKYYVYVHINKSNGKKYYGITNNISARWGHQGNAYIKSSCRAFGAAVQKYGWDGFEHKILHKDISVEEACKLEQYYIARDKTNIPRDNMVKVTCVETGQSFDCLADAARFIGLKSTNGIRDSCKNHIHTSGGFHWRYT